VDHGGCLTVLGCCSESLFSDEETARAGDVFLIHVTGSREGDSALMVGCPTMDWVRLERVPMGTPYPEVVERVRRIVRSAELAGRCHVAVDATGVGRPVVDPLQRAGLGCAMLPVVITGGDAEGHSDGYYRVPQEDLIVGLQVLLQRGGLQIAAGLEWGEALVEEMAGMQVKQATGGRVGAVWSVAGRGA